jgi:hypothetical protein
VRVEHGRRLVGAEETGTGVRAMFADGSEAVGDVLIGWAARINNSKPRALSPGSSVTPCCRRS